MRASWDEFYLMLAAVVSSRSKDTSTKCGCVLVDIRRRVLSLGYNGIVSECEDRLDRIERRPEKYFWMEHAERNAIYNATGDLGGSTAYITAPPCSDCARALIASGIVRIVVPKKHNMLGRGEKWDASWKVAKEMLSEAGVIVSQVDVDVLNVLQDVFLQTFLDFQGLG